MIKHTSARSAVVRCCWPGGVDDGACKAALQGAGGLESHDALNCVPAFCKRQRGCGAAEYESRCYAAAAIVRAVAFLTRC
jgi:hypothetical protein